MKIILIYFIFIFLLACKKEDVDVWIITEKTLITDTTKLDSITWKYIESITSTQIHFVGTEKEVFKYKNEHEFIVYFKFKQEYGKFFIGYEKHEISFLKLK